MSLVFFDSSDCNELPIVTVLSSTPAEVGRGEFTNLTRDLNIRLISGDWEEVVVRGSDVVVVVEVGVTTGTVLVADVVEV